LLWRLRAQVLEEVDVAEAAGLMPGSDSLPPSWFTAELQEGLATAAGHARRIWLLANKRWDQGYVPCIADFYDVLAEEVSQRAWAGGVGFQRTVLRPGQPDHLKHEGCARPRGRWRV
jgi:hypothetical protein